VFEIVAVEVQDAQEELKAFGGADIEQIYFNKLGYKSPAVLRLDL
jgi:hypothetical protein